MNKLTPRQRWLNCMRDEPVDRVPLQLEGFHAESHEQLAEWPDPRKRELAERLYDELHFWIQVPSHVNRYLVTPGQRMRTIEEDERSEGTVTTHEIDTPKGKLTFRTGRNPTSNTTWTIKYPVESLGDIEKIRSIPWELPANLSPPDMDSLPADFDQRGIVRLGISSPFVCVAGMMPYDYFLELCATELELMKELSAICMDRILSILDVILAKKTVEYVWMGGCEWVTPPMGSPKLYEELVQTFEEPVIRRIHEAGAVSHIHCHGNVRTTLERVIARGGDYFEPVEPPPDGDITFDEAKALAAGRMTLGGNVEARVLENAGEEEFETAARAPFQGTKERMVYHNTAGPICALTDTSYRNYSRLIDVWDELSPI